MQYSKKLQTHWSELERGDKKAIHEVRKLTRKAQAFLRANGAPKKAHKPWRKLRQAISPVRDLDVTYDHLKKLLKAQQADAATLDLLRVHFSTERARTWQKLKLPDPPRDQPTEQDDRVVLEVLEDDWAALVKESSKVLTSEDATAWHTWRKHLKRYRYTFELLQEVPEPLLALLGHLGDMQDMEVMKAFLQDSPTFLQPYLPELQDLVRTRHQESQEQARQVWEGFTASHQLLIES